MNTRVTIKKKFHDITMNIEPVYIIIFALLKIYQIWNTFSWGSSNHSPSFLKKKTLAYNYIIVTVQYMHVLVNKLPNLSDQTINKNVQSHTHITWKYGKCRGAYYIPHKLQFSNSHWGDSSVCSIKISTLYDKQSNKLIIHLHFSVNSSFSFFDVMSRPSNFCDNSYKRPPLYTCIQIHHHNNIYMIQF